MTDLELLHFEQLKNEVQAQYLENHTPSFDEISKWKGIDIIYFQEDLRKIAKGNISEKSFYTYFKTSPSSKLPRIDMLNLLSIYAGYASWYDFKKNHLFANEILQEAENLSQTDEEELEKELKILPETENSTRISEKTPNSLPEAQKTLTENPVLQKSNTENQNVKEISPNFSTYDTAEQNTLFSLVKKYLWLGISAILAVIVGLLGFGDQIFSKKYYYSFIDADRNSKINAELQVQILQDNQSPILYTAKPNEPFVYTTKSDKLTMVVSSPYYRTDTIKRNLDNAPEAETIELKPNDYAIMLFYYSKSIKDLKRKRESLNFLISNNALIYQIYDNEKYGVETMDKQRYISLVTLPTTSLENIEVIETKNDSNGKINMIKFRIATNEESK